MKTGFYKYPRSCRIDYHTKYFITQLLDKIPERRITLEETKEMVFFDDM